MRIRSALIAAVAAVGVPLVAAVVYLAAHDWFGAGDLWAFAFWSVPFAGLVTFVGHRLHAWLSTQSKHRRYALVVAGGALTGVCWTLALAAAMGVWIGAFSVPILYLWVLGGVAAGLVFAALPISASKRTAPHNRSPRLLLLWVLAVPAGAAGLAFLILFGSMFGSIYIWDRAEPEVHLLPHGYEGPVLIVFDQPDGEPATYRNQTRVYEIPSDGVLKSQFGPNDGWRKREYWYVSPDGEHSPIVSGLPCDHSLPPQTIQACLMGRMWMSDRSGPEYSAYTLGPTASQRELYSRGDSLVKAVVFGVGP